MPIRHRVRDVLPFLAASSTSPLVYAESEATKQQKSRKNNNERIKHVHNKSSTCCLT